MNIALICKIRVIGVLGLFFDILSCLEEGLELGSFIVSLSAITRLTPGVPLAGETGVPGEYRQLTATSVTPEELRSDPGKFSTA